MTINLYGNVIDATHVYISSKNIKAGTNGSKEDTTVRVNRIYTFTDIVRFINNPTDVLKSDFESLIKTPFDTSVYFVNNISKLTLNQPPTYMKQAGAFSRLLDSNVAIEYIYRIANSNEYYRKDLKIKGQDKNSYVYANNRPARLTQYNELIYWSESGKTAYEGESLSYDIDFIETDQEFLDMMLDQYKSNKEFFKHSLSDDEILDYIRKNIE